MIKFIKNSEGNFSIRIRISKFTNREYVSPIDFQKYIGKVADFFVIHFRKDEFAKKNYSLFNRLHFWKFALPKDLLKE
jgi:hypothetical protein